MGKMEGYLSPSMSYRAAVSHTRPEADSIVWRTIRPDTYTARNLANLNVDAMIIRGNPSEIAVA
jgi:hypothetical protein